MPSPPVRFLAGVLGLWIAGRVAMVEWEEEEPVEVAEAVPAGFSPSLLRRQAPVASSAGDGISDRESHGPLPPEGRRVVVATDRSLSEQAVPGPARMLLAAPLPEARRAADGPPQQLAAEPPGGLAAAPAPAVAPLASRWSGSLLLFAREGGGAVPLAGGGGQLGASQAGARIAYRLDAAGRIAATARAYAPLEAPRGAEAAVGIDLMPVRGAAFRLSVERRIGLGREGRDAWSGYAAGGFYRGLGRTGELDGYAQAGVVGARARDLFADGAVRIARRVEVGGATFLAGAGAWGAAQPGAARLDIGPRVAARLPAGRATVTIAGEWRARIAGDARPRSGPALTVAADF